MYTATCFCLPYKMLAIITWNNDFSLILLILYIFFSMFIVQQMYTFIDY
jgi:hypothetical protein